jgi:SEFIR domain-containing protein
MADAPSIMISWAHRDLGWDDARAKSWSDEVVGLATALRTIGFETEIDLFHLHERHMDWSRWGPQQVRQQDVVLIAASQGWRERWEGTNDPHLGAGAAAEADALLGIYHSDGQRAFREKVIVVVLPSMRHKRVIPDRLTGVNRVELDDFSEQSLSPLVHLLRESPLYDLPPLGVLPPLAPVPPPEPGNSLDQDLEVLDERIRTLRSAAAGLSNAERRSQRPTHERISLQIDLQLAELLKERAKHLERSARSRARGGRVAGREREQGLAGAWSAISKALAVIAVGVTFGALSAVALDRHANAQHRDLARASSAVATGSLATVPDPPRILTLPHLQVQSQSRTAGDVSGLGGSSSTQGTGSNIDSGSATSKAPASDRAGAGGTQGTNSDHAGTRSEGGGTKESSGGA